ncbi:AAA family ATPase [Alkalihalobacillus pseudalcaliphilus]|uniref:AAA family ATPase n=1 Tax=Alkalihalobacillus pseudalcaliphilus TaxID=79884 RepID=UPI00064D9F5B|nr:MoxR family ATPase [Alkalihalobacillus pseudalcaliphilus]KMK75008.1 magnesium chelatase [Alkalihalobacillus pseudalcaliphilus]
MKIKDIQTLGQSLKENVQKVIVGKDDIIDLLLVGLFSSSHILLDDVPGTGKTLLAKTVSKSLGMNFKRVQFTPDLLPTDLTGIQFYNQKLGEFEFRAGPLFTNLLLADEINRATPRTQSSLLECMEERQVTIDGETHTLDRPFMVIATQNPVESQGTFPLPEAQLDRFLVKVAMGYPNKEEGISILRRFKGDHPLETLQPVASREDIKQAQHIFSDVHISDDLLTYIMNLIEATRNHDEIELGVSPRGSQALLKAAQVYAALKGRDYVEPDDIKRLAKPVLSHRIVTRQLYQDGDTNEKIIEQILTTVEVPVEKELLEGTNQ